MIGSSKRSRVVSFPDKSYRNKESKPHKWFYTDTGADVTESKWNDTVNESHNCVSSLPNLMGIGESWSTSLNGGYCSWLTNAVGANNRIGDQVALESFSIKGVMNTVLSYYGFTATGFGPQHYPDVSARLLVLLDKQPKVNAGGFIAPTPLDVMSFATESTSPFSFPNPDNRRRFKILADKMFQFGGYFNDNQFTISSDLNVRVGLPLLPDDPVVLVDGNGTFQGTTTGTVFNTGLMPIFTGGHQSQLFDIKIDFDDTIVTYASQWANKNDIYVMLMSNAPAEYNSVQVEYNTRLTFYDD